MNKIIKVICITAVTTLFGAYPAMAQSHGANANGGTGASMNGGSGSDDRNEGPVSGSGTPANSGSRASNSTSSNTNGDGNNSDDNGTAHNTHAHKHHHSRNHNSPDAQNGQ